MACGPSGEVGTTDTSPAIAPGDTSAPTETDSGLPTTLGCGALLSVEGFGGLQGEGDPVIAVASDGTTYVTAYFQGELTLDAGGANETTLTATGTLDTLVAQYDAAGVFQWARQVGGTSTSSPRGLAALDDGVGLVGSFVSGATVGVGEADAVPLSAAGSTDVFVARFDSVGAVSWAVGYGGFDSDFSEGVTTLDDGSLVVASTHHSQVTVGAGDPGQAILPLAPGATSLVSLAKFSGGTGAVQWVQTVSGDLTAKVDDVATTGDQVVVVGYVEGPGTATFGAGQPSESTLEPVGDLGFVARYASDATLLWVSSIDGWGPDAVSMASDGSALVAGAFTGQAVFAAGEVDEVTVASAATDVFLARFSAIGAFQWAVQSDTIAGGLTTPYDVAAEPDGGAVVVGSLSNRARFGADEVNEASLVADGLWDGYAARYDPDGQLECAIQIGGSQMDASYAVVQRPSGAWEVVGYFSDTASASLGAADAEPITAVGGTDIFRATYAF